MEAWEISAEELPVRAAGLPAVGGGGLCPAVSWRLCRWGGAGRGGCQRNGGGGGSECQASCDLRAGLEPGLWWLSFC